MKKLLLLSLIFIYTQSGCKKGDQMVDPFIELKSELNEIRNGNVEFPYLLLPCNSDNPYDSWGEELYNNVLKIVLENATKSDNDKEVLRNKFLDAIPKEFFISETRKVDTKKVEEIFKEFLLLFIKRNIYEALPLSLKMEEKISKTSTLKEQDKELLLKMVSILRYSTYFCFLDNSKSITGSYEDCWKRKLQETANSGFFERMSCVFAWPACFAYKLADCGIEEIQDHLLK